MMNRIALLLYIEEVEKRGEKRQFLVGGEFTVAEVRTVLRCLEKGCVLRE